jgi:hypothetical protein
LTGATVLVPVLAILSVLTVELRNSRSLQLAAETRNALPDRLDIALARAAQAQSIQDIPEARTSLLATFSSSPHLAGIFSCRVRPSAIAFSQPTNRPAIADNEEVSFWNASTLETLPRSDGTDGAFITGSNF